MTGVVATADPGLDPAQADTLARHGLARLAVRPAGSLIVLGLAIAASALPLTGEGLGSSTALATALGIAWDSARTDLRIAAFAGATVLLLAALLTAMSVLPGTWIRRVWIALAVLCVLAMGVVAVALRSNAGSAVSLLGAGAVVLCVTIVVDLVLESQRRRTTLRGT